MCTNTIGNLQASSLNSPMVSRDHNIQQHLSSLDARRLRTFCYHRHICRYVPSLFAMFIVFYLSFAMSYVFADSTFFVFQRVDGSNVYALHQRTFMKNPEQRQQGRTLGLILFGSASIPQDTSPVETYMTDNDMARHRRFSENKE